MASSAEAQPRSPSPSTSALYKHASEAYAYLQARLPPSLSVPKLAIICGTGLGGLADSLNDDEKAVFDYKNIPYFPVSGVVGHAGKLIFGTKGEAKIPTVLMLGRVHYYEGHDIAEITFPTRLFKLLGVDTMIVTNAAGGLNEEYNPGDVVVINDHISLAGLSGIHPLRGPNAEEFGVRFPPLSDAYDINLRRIAHKTWLKLWPHGASRKKHEGVYAYAGGPSYETRAECRLLRLLGADVVGMSTVPEIIVARHSGLRVLAISLVTNKAVLAPTPRADVNLDTVTEGEQQLDGSEGKANHEEVMEEGRRAALDMQTFVKETVVAMYAS